MKLLNKIWEFIIKLIISAYITISGIIIGLIVGLIFKSTAIGIFTFFGIFLGYVLFIWIRQIYWKITKKGDYGNKNKKG